MATQFSDTGTKSPDWKQVFVQRIKMKHLARKNLQKTSLNTELFRGALKLSFVVTVYQLLKPINVS